MRRFQARGRSKNGIIKKFFSHLRIIVTEKTVEEGK
jgi:ribosomal protein L22